MSVNTTLNLLVFSLNSTSLLADLKSITLKGDFDQANYAGAGSRYELNRNTKQGQSVDVTLFQPVSGALPADNLDITVWSLGGDYLAEIRGGAINITCPTKEGSGIAAAYKNPVLVAGEQVEVTCQKLVTAAPIFDTLIGGTESEFYVTVAITFGGFAFSMPMALKASSVKHDRGEVTMEDVTFTSHGAPTGPSATTSVFGEVLRGANSFTLAFDNGITSYAGTGIFTKFNTTFSDAQMVEQTGTLMIQGALTPTAD